MRPTALAVLGSLAIACASPTGEPMGATGALSDGTPEGVGLITLLNDASTTVAVLDIDAGLDRRAAVNLIAHRDGRDARLGTADDDLYGSIAEVDAVSYVGPAALDLLLAFADAQGFVPMGDEPLGVWDNVAFTVDEAEATLAFVNGATETELREVLRDSRPVASIVAARPLASMLAVSQLYYVGATMMQRLEDAAAVSCAVEAIPAETGWGASCTAVVSPFYATAAASDATVTVPFGEQCTLGDRESRAVDYWREHWIAEDQPWEWDPGFPLMNVRTETWSDGRSRVTVDIGADEDDMHFHFDASGALVYFLHVAQSNNQYWFCAAPGDATTGEPDPDCMALAQSGECTPEF